MQEKNQTAVEPSEKVLALHRQAIVVDGLSVPHLTEDQASRMREGGVTAIGYTASPENVYDPDLASALAEIARVRQLIEGQPHNYRIATSVADIEAAKADGHIAIILGLQNASPIGDQVELLSVLYFLGVRIVQLTYNTRNLIGDGCAEPANAGLSQFGQRVIKEMNRLGMLIDLSHCGYRTTREAIEASELPVAFTHSNPSGMSPNPRNKPDDLLRALAERDGVVGMCAYGKFAHRDKGRRPRLTDFLDILDYTVDLIGVDHVGIGLDEGENWQREFWESELVEMTKLYPEVIDPRDWFGFDTRYVEGLSSAAHFPNLTAGLLDRGYSSHDVLKILGGNWLRLYRQAWSPAEVNS